MVFYFQFDAVQVGSDERATETMLRREDQQRAERAVQNRDETEARQKRESSRRSPKFLIYFIPISLFIDPTP